MFVYGGPFCAFAFSATKSGQANAKEDKGWGGWGVYLSIYRISNEEICRGFVARESTTTTKLVANFKGFGNQCSQSEIYGAIFVIHGGGCRGGCRRGGATPTQIYHSTEMCIFGREKESV